MAWIAARGLGGLATRGERGMGGVSRQGTSGHPVDVHRLASATLFLQALQASVTSVMCGTAAVFVLVCESSRPPIGGPPTFARGRHWAPEWPDDAHRGR